MNVQPAMVGTEQVTAAAVLSPDTIADAIGQHRPTVEQRRVIEAPPDQPVLVVAGAGSGKTETMSARVVWLVANRFVEPEQVLGLTFTRKAAGELSERIGRRLRRLRQVGLWTPDTSDDPGAALIADNPTVSTYHAYAGRLVGEHGMRLGIEPDARLLSEAAAWQYAHEVVTAYDGPMDAVDKQPSTITAAVVDLAGALAEHLRTPEDLEAYLRELEQTLAALPRPQKGRVTTLGDAGEVLTIARAQQALLPMVRTYLDLKHRRSALDHGDQMALAARLAMRFGVVAQMERARFKAVLLDEFQDTSEAQLRLLAALFADPDGPVPVTAVGDPHQSIYGWRGASATTLAAFRQAFAGSSGPAPVLPLSTSWRNDDAVLEAANATAAPLREASLVPVEQLHARPDNAAGEVVLARFETIEQEALAVAHWVRRQWFDEQGERTGSSAAVLCRKRSQFPMIAEALAEVGLPVEVVGIGGLLTTPEVNDLVSLLWVVQDPSRGDRLLRLLVGPAIRLGPADLDGLWAWSRELFANSLEQEAAEHDEQQTTGSPQQQDSGPDRDPHRATRDIAQDSRDQATLVEGIEHLPDESWRGRDDERISPTALRRLASLGRMIARLRSMTGLPLSDLVVEAQRSLGLDIEALSRPEHTNASAMVHLDAFADVTAQFSAVADRPTLGGFLDWLEAAESEERGLDQGFLEVDTDAVQILTVHAAKGLEWDVVAVPGMVEGSFPSYNGALPRWVEDPAGWRIGSQGVPGDPGTWLVKDKGWAVGLAGLPYDLRGDVDGLPRLDWRSAVDMKDMQDRHAQFVRDGGEHAIAEERRLAYVAFTRARHRLLLTSAVWGDGASVRLASRFITELRRLPDVRLGPWAEDPTAVNGKAPANPRLEQDSTRVWPHDPLERRRAQLADGALAVRAAAEDLDDRVGAQASIEQIAAAARDSLGVTDLDDEVFVLLAERERRRRPTPPQVQVPRHLSTSALVSLAADPEQFARRLRRPMPQAPAPAARRGTLFHAWVEQHFADAALVDVDALPGAADNTEDPAELAVLQRNFLASPWAGMVPVALEVDLETVLDGIAVRGRIDAVFADPDRVPEQGPGFVVVDWKTGRPPRGEDAAARAVQVGAYALAYARLRGLDPSAVRAAFFYAATGETVWPQVPTEQDLVDLLRRVPD